MITDFRKGLIKRFVLIDVEGVSSVSALNQSDRGVCAFRFLCNKTVRERERISKGVKEEERESERMRKNKREIKGRARENEGERMNKKEEKKNEKG